MISIVVPARNEENNIGALYKKITSLLSENESIINYEIIFVDDGSTDDTWHNIKNILKDTRVHGLKFSRNFGKEAAIFAGLHKTKGNCAIVMDCDLQHPPNLILTMYKYYLDGYQIVRCIKKPNNENSTFRKICNRFFYHVFEFMAGTEFNIANSSDFQLIDRKVIDYILKFQEASLFFRGISAYVGFRIKDVEFDVPERISGNSKWSFYELASYAFSNVTAFSSKPLQIITFNGLLLLFITIILTIRTLYVYYINTAAPGITTVIILLLFIGSSLMISLGIIGFYIGKIYDEVKHRPRYIIDEDI